MHTCPGVRQIWQPRHLKLNSAVLSWSKYETDTVDRGSVVLDSRWCVSPDEIHSGARFCDKTHEFCSRNDGICTENDEFRTENDVIFRRQPGRC